MVYLEVDNEVWRFPDINHAFLIAEHLLPKVCTIHDDKSLVQFIAEGTQPPEAIFKWLRMAEKSKEWI